MNSKIVQVTTSVISGFSPAGLRAKRIITTVLCEDGTLWRDNLEGAWYEMQTTRLELEGAE